MIILYVLVVVSSTMFGVVISSNMKKKSCYFKELIGFLDSYKQNISYLQKPMKELIEYELSKHKELSITLKSFIENRLDKNAKLELPFYLNTSQKQLIEKTFYNLGTLDANSEIDRIEKARIEIKTEEELSKNTYEKYGSAVVKIGLLLGLMVVILLL